MKSGMHISEKKLSIFSNSVRQSEIGTMTAAAAVVDCSIHLWSDVAHQNCRSRFPDGNPQPTNCPWPITEKNRSITSLRQISCLSEGDLGPLSSSRSWKKTKQSICFRESRRESENVAVLFTIRGSEHNTVPAPARAGNSSGVDVISEGEISPRGTGVPQLVTASLADQSSSSSPEVDNGGIGGGGGGGGSNDGNGSFHRGNGGGGGGGGGGKSGGGDGEESGGQEDEFGPILDGERVQQEVQSKGITLPPDMLEAAKTVGIRQLLLSRYIELQGAPWPLGPAIRGNTMLRNRMLADPTFLFKVFTEVAIDSGCATFAEIQKRGKDFWSEFELYLSDLSVGIVLDVALVGMLAPFVQFGSVSAVGSGTRARLSRAIQALPSSMFEAQRPGRSFSLQQRVSTLFYKAGQYGIAGFACGIVGQGLASSLMTIKRKLKNSEEEEVKVPSIMKSALLWAVFMGVSSNTRYQIINGLERVVEGSVVTKQVPQIAAAFTVGIRFANNIYGGMQFVDWARLAGVQ